MARSEDGVCLALGAAWGFLSESVFRGEFFSRGTIVMKNSAFFIKIYLCLFAASILPILAHAQAGFEDDRVMLQGFYWESYRQYLELGFIWSDNAKGEASWDLRAFGERD